MRWLWWLCIGAREDTTWSNQKTIQTQSKTLLPRVLEPDLSANYFNLACLSVRVGPVVGWGTGCQMCDGRTVDSWQLTVDSLNLTLQHTPHTRRAGCKKLSTRPQTILLSKHPPHPLLYWCMTLYITWRIQMSWGFVGGWSKCCQQQRNVAISRLNPS